MTEISHIAKNQSSVVFRHGLEAFPASVGQITPMTKSAASRWFLKQWRQHRGYNQQRMAEMSELSLGYYNEVETGKRRYNQDLLEKFADVLQCDPADLITRDPADPEAIWDLYDKMTSTQRAQVVEIAKTLLKVS